MNELKEIKHLIKKIRKAKEKIEFYDPELYLSYSEELKKKEIKRINDKINEEKSLIEVTKRKIERIIKDLLDKI